MGTEKPQISGFSSPFKWGKKKKDDAKPADKPAAEAAPPVTTEPAAAPPPPVVAAAPPPAATTASAPPRAKTVAANKPAERIHTVRAGDTLWDIAAKYYNDGRKYKKIAAANKIADPDKINVGLKLKIPS